MSSDDEVPSPQPDESRILIRDRARVIPREVSEGLLPVALLRPHLGSLPLGRPPLGFLLLRPFRRLGKREQNFESGQRSCDPP